MQNPSCRMGMFLLHDVVLNLQNSSCHMGMFLLHTTSIVLNLQGGAEAARFCCYGRASPKATSLLVTFTGTL